MSEPQPSPAPLHRSRWVENLSPRKITIPHGTSVVTCLVFSHRRIITASDDHSIRVHSVVTGALELSLNGHKGGVWALAATRDTLVSASTDRTIRLWDLKTGRCTHVFGGHTSTVRCIAIVKPELVDVPDENGSIKRERWPKNTTIVSGSRDNTLRVWQLPEPGGEEYRCVGADSGSVDEENPENNPYHLQLLEGHKHAVRALAARGRTVVSGSYDNSVRVWDIVTGRCQWVLEGHTQKVYAVVLDLERGQAYSGSMDATVRIWSLQSGQCLRVLTGHTSLVGLLALSRSYLASASADSTLRIWDPSTGQCLRTLQSPGYPGVVTCFTHDDTKVVSATDGELTLWNVADGKAVRQLLAVSGVWQVAFDGRWCVAASNSMDQTYLNIWDFGTEGVADSGVGEWELLGHSDSADEDDGGSDKE